MEAFQLFCNFSPRFAQRRPSFRKAKKEMGREGVSDERLSTRNIFLNFRGQVVRQGREEMKKSSKKSESFFIQFSDVEFYRGTLSLSLDDSYDISSRKIRN